MDPDTLFHAPGLVERVLRSFDGTGAYRYHPVPRSAPGSGTRVPSGLITPPEPSLLPLASAYDEEMILIVPSFKEPRACHLDTANICVMMASRGLMRPYYAVLRRITAVETFKFN